MSLQKKIIALILMLIVIILGIGLWNMSDSSNVIPQESIPVTSIEGWVSSSAYVEAIKQFESKHPEYHIEVRVFRSPEQLYDELSAAISANAAPQFAEVGGLYGIPQLAESGMLLELDQHFSEELWTQLHPALVTAFKYEGKIWALPLGGEIPFVYYNQNMFELAGLLESAVTDTSGMMQAASQLTFPPRASQSSEKWGLSIDKDVPWYLINWAYSSVEKELSAKWRVSFELWHEFVFGDKMVMKQLQHHLAASHFINGQAAMFISSSGKLPMLTQYIGGKFSFDGQPLPLLGDPPQAGYVTHARGMVLLPSQPEKVKAAEQLLAFMIDPELQASVLLPAGQLPANEAFITYVDPNADNSMMDALLSVRNELLALSPSPVQLKRWQQLMEISEQIELAEDADLSALVEQVLNVIHER